MQRAPMIELYFDFSCPYAYIAATQIEALAARGGAVLLWRPMLLGGVFRSIGSADSPMSAMGPAKAWHNVLDMHRWAAHYGAPLRMPAAHPMRTVRALRALLAASESAWPRIIRALYAAYWQRGEDITSPDVVRAALASAGLSADEAAAAVAMSDDPAIKDELARRTAEAVTRGVFGAPTMFVHVPDEPEPLMFWGQDRLHMVSAVLDGWRPGRGAPPPSSEPAPCQPPAEGATLHYWYDFSSPFAYLGATQIQALAARTGARVRWRPMLLGGLFREIGTPDVPLFAMPEAKQAYMRREFGYWSSWWSAPFAFPSRFPMRTVTALRLALLAGDRIAELSLALFRAYWAEDRDIDDRATLESVLSGQGFDAAEMLARAKEPEVKQMLVENTAEAAAAGVFGAPTCIVEDARGNHLFWGQDRLDLVEATLRGWLPDQPRS